MKRARKILKFLGLGLLVLIIVAAAGGVWFVRRPWPQVSGTIAGSGVSAPVQIIRDRWGVPQIYAQNERDLFFAQGYAHAQDRLWQMEFNRRIGSGTLSAAIGGPTIGFDMFTRSLGIRRAAQQEWETLDDDSRAVLEAYSAGVNAFVAANRNRLPVEFTIFRITPAPWTPLDSLSWGKLMSFNLGWNNTFELLRADLIAKAGTEAAQQLLPPYSDGPPLEIPPEANGYHWLRAAQLAGRDPLLEVLGGTYYNQGSNNWVLAGSRTESGKPLLASDTHLQMNIPNIWYENGLHGGRFDVVGFSFPGVPAVILGHNQRIAWGLTDMPADVQDLYIEKLDSAENPTRYEFEGAWQPLEVITETIEVAGGPPQTLTIRRTRHGPLINEMFGLPPEAEPLAMQWTVADGVELFRGVVELNRATSWDQFRAALSHWGAPNQNFVYADVDGNIGYQAAGEVPRRAEGHQGLVPVPGWTGEYEWQGRLAFDELYTVYNPPEGFIATANARAQPDDYPHYVATEWSDPFRIARINALLQSKPQLTIADMQQIQGETYSLPAEQLRPALLALQPENPLQQQALAQLEQWDLRSETDRVGPSIFGVWYWFMVQETLGDELGEDLMQRYQYFSWVHMPEMIRLMQQPDSAWFDDTTTPATERRDEIVRRSFNAALDWLRERYGDDPAQWTWGRLHTMTFVHQPLGQSGIAPVEWLFNSDPIPARGDELSVNAGWFNAARPFAMIGGTAQRLIVDLGDLRATQAINATGQSGHVFHPHREDMIPLWQNVQYHPLFFERADAEADAEGVLTLAP